MHIYMHTHICIYIYIYVYMFFLVFGSSRSLQFVAPYCHALDFGLTSFASHQRDHAAKQVEKVVAKAISDLPEDWDALFLGYHDDAGRAHASAYEDPVGMEEVVEARI